VGEKLPAPAPRVTVISSRAKISPRAKTRWRLVPTIIVHGSQLFRAGLMHFLAGSPFRIEASYHELSDIPEHAFGDKDCVALIEADENSETICSRISALKQQHQGLRIVMISDRLHPDRLLAAIGAGADGYLLEDEINRDALLKSLELILMEGVVVPQGLTTMVNGRLKLQPEEIPTRPQQEQLKEEERPSNRMAGSRLSEREQMILMHLTEGASNKHIARALKIAEATVKVHIKSLLRKIRVSNRTQAAMWAINNVRSGELPATGLTVEAKRAGNIICLPRIAQTS
jgi:two-component system, NarL family, nitrate/nitrite response regulator NarL